MEAKKAQRIFGYIDEFLRKLHRIGVPDKVNRAYKRRIFVKNLDANGRGIGSDLYETGELKRATNVTPFGVTTLPYGLYIEQRRNIDIFSFSDREIDIIEEEIVSQIENNIEELT